MYFNFCGFGFAALLESKQVTSEKLHFFEERNFKLLSGTTVDIARIGYCVFGDTSKPIIILHTAVSGNPKAYSVNKENYGDGWWNRHFGDSKLFDLNKFCVICFSHFGGNGPSSTADELELYKEHISILDTCYLAAKAF